MRFAQYLKAEGHINAADSGGILERWRMGRRLLLDESAMTASGKSLRHGVRDRLIANAKAKGYKPLTEQEIQWRLACARAYPTEAQIHAVVTDFESFRSLARAGFPDYERPEGESDYDPRWTDEKDRDTRNRGARLLPELDDDEQLSLFPDDRFGDYSTLDELAKYAAEMRAITARFAGRDDERDAYIRRLADAVGGDMSRTWGEARNALGESGGGER